MAIKGEYLFLLFLLLIPINFFGSMFVVAYGIDLLNFIALEFFNEKDFYVFKQKSGSAAMYGLYFINIGLWLFLAYSLFCYWLYSKYQGVKFFLIISAIFVAYFLYFILNFSSYRLANFLLHFIPFCLMYVEIILLYKSKVKSR